MSAFADPIIIVITSQIVKHNLQNLLKKQDFPPQLRKIGRNL